MKYTIKVFKQHLSDMNEYMTRFCTFVKLKHDIFQYDLCAFQLNLSKMKLHAKQHQEILMIKKLKSFLI